MTRLLFWTMVPLFCGCTERPPVPNKKADGPAERTALPEGFTMEETDDRSVVRYLYENLMIEGEPGCRFKVVRAGETSEAPLDTALRDTLFHDRRFTLLGSNRQIEACFIRWSTTQRPELYPAKAYSGALTAPVISSDPEGRYWRTVIRRDCAEEGVNFGGHYTIAEWGCGAMCQLLAVIDRVDGHIYLQSIPFDTLDGHYGVSYSRDSRMIVVNSSLLDMRPGYRWLFSDSRPAIYVWNEHMKKFELVEPDPKHREPGS